MEIHLLGNAHLDPVWLWDWREGLNEGLITVRTILDLMDEDKEMTFIRGESAIYRHIEETDPATFRRIRRQVENGRWDIVGGTLIQPDTNLAGVETLTRHFTRGQTYFQSRFGRRVTAAWQADSFGHTAGLPEILTAAGIDSFAFTRPDHKTLPLREPAFWWEGPGGSRILAYRPTFGWYGTDRDELPRRLDGCVQMATTSRLETVACFFGLGDHGGGPSRRQLADIRAWAAAHPEIKIIHSGLHRFFAALRSEVKRKGENVIPLHRGELNFCLRGCYSSAARFKFLYRRGENLLSRAEMTDSAVAGLVGRKGADLTEAWDGILFNSFHDILPGSSIERAFEDQTAWMGSVIHTAQKTELRSLNELAARIDTRVLPARDDLPGGVAALVWNPHPQTFRGQVELEAGLDYRIIEKYRNRVDELPIRVLDAKGRKMPFQEIKNEHSCMTDVAWRKRVILPVVLPAFGWNVVEMAWIEDAKIPAIRNPVRGGPDWIENHAYRVEAKPGASGIQIFHRGHPVFQEDGLSALVYEDPWGSWGSITEENESTHIGKVREQWTIARVELLENGPLRATLWVQLTGSHSRIDLSVSLCHGLERVEISARAMWDERSARLKLRFPAGDRAEFEVPGATVKREPCGDVPGGRWVRVRTKGGGFGFVSDSLYAFDAGDGRLQTTVTRATRYANDIKTEVGAELWRPIVDTGELKFRFWITPPGADLPALSRELEQPPVILLVPAKKGPLPRVGSLASLEPASLQLLAWKRAEDGKGFILRAQAPAGKTVRARFEWLGQKIPLGVVRGGQIISWRLIPIRRRWKASRTDVAEGV